MDVLQATWRLYCGMNRRVSRYCLPMAEAAKTDGLVAYASAHVEDVASEKVVSAGHLCQDHPEVIGEVKRILMEHAEQ